MTARSIAILGVTGSIGRSTMAVIAAQREAFRVEAVASGRDVDALAEAALSLGARFAAIADESLGARLKERLSGSGIRCGAGAEAVIEAAIGDADLVVAGIAGTAGVLPTYAAVRAGKTVALANKECLVCAGEAFMRDAKRFGATILPLDSEHNAIFQALGTHQIADVDTMVLTASGGPFRTWSAEAIASATPSQALAHPNWSMGTKVTIDSASLMNKGLELIEAHHIFGIEASRLDILVHPQSIVHGLVSFKDGSVTAGMAVPDMRVPIAHCLGFPERVASGAAGLDLAAIGRLDFLAPDLARFPALALALKALRAGGTMPTVLNAANEIAVARFLAGECRFDAITKIVEASLDWAAGRNWSPLSVEDWLVIDAEVRRVAVADAVAFAAEAAQ
jgi:1-deoxy-D-xylulose-5-phosphate reductoisomerase